MRAIRRQLDQVDAAVWPCEEFANVWPFVVSGVVPDHMDEALVRVARLNPGEKLRGADPVDGGWIDKRCIEALKVERAMNGECQVLCVRLIGSMLPERSKDDDNFKRTAGRVTEGLQAA